MPQSQDEAVVEQALANSVGTLPQDIRASTLRALLEIDGFEIDESASGVTASFMDADFPCLTYYEIRWQVSEIGAVEDLHAIRKRKCV